MSLIATVLGSGAGIPTGGCGAAAATRDFVSIAKATAGAWIELRLDAWASVAGGTPTPSDVHELLEAVLLATGKPVLASCPRMDSPTAKGASGLYEDDESNRQELLLAAARAGASWIDVDTSSLPTFAKRIAGGEAQLGAAKVLLSLHFESSHGADSRRIMAELDGRLEELLANQDSLASVGGIKLIAHCPAVDGARAGEHGLALLCWLRAARDRWRDRGLSGIVFAGGAGGAFTRTLAPALGSDHVFAAADGGLRVSGQPSASELAKTWPSEYPTIKTRIFGILGSPVAASLSPQIFTALFRAHGIDAVYGRLDTMNPAAAFAFAELDEVRGLSVTAPHKGHAQKFAFGSLDEFARRVGATNTLTRRRGDTAAALQFGTKDPDWLGANTDVEGVRVALGLCDGGLPRHQQAIVIGAGGAARAVLGALCGQDSGRVTVLARRPKAALALAREFGASVGVMADLDGLYPDILVHTTPAGSVAQPGVLPIEKRQLQQLAKRVPQCVVLDAIYHPSPTPLVELAEECGLDARDGLEWFLAQGRAQFKMFTGESARAGVAREAALQALRSPWIALIGLRATGKSTVGELLAARLGLPFVDLDKHLAERVGAESAGAHLLNVGEQRFREDESEALRDVLSRPQSGVVATGGGVVEHPLSRELLASSRSKCVLLTASPDVCVKRMAADPTLRPRLTPHSASEVGGTNPAEVRAVGHRRDPMLAALAHATFDSESLTADELALTILEQL